MWRVIWPNRDQFLGRPIEAWSDERSGIKISGIDRRVEPSASQDHVVETCRLKILFNKMILNYLKLIYLVP